MAIAETSNQLISAQPFSWTLEQVLSLSPDPGSTKRGKALAHVAKWPLLGASGRALWGECQGSGKKPYRTIIDLSAADGSAADGSAANGSAADGEPAFRCSCPSRKFPCKHALALFLLRVGETGFSEGAPPAWVSDWLEKRSQTAEKKQAKTPQKVVDLSDDEKQAKAEQVAKRLHDRTAKVEAGLEDFDQWLQDIMRQGLASLPTRPYSFWDQAAARLVDAQAPGLAGRVRALAGVPHSGERWPNRMLKALGQLHLLIQGYGQREKLAPAMQAEVKRQIGWTQKQDTLLAQAEQSASCVDCLSDTWYVLGKVVTEEEKLKTQRVWLWGAQHQKAALVLSFAHGRRQPLDASLRPGMSFEGQLVFYPGTGIQRAFVTTRKDPADLAKAALARATLGVEQIETAIAHYGQTLVQNPWTVRFPMILRAISLRYQTGDWWLQDGTGQGLPITAGFSQGWELLALGGGRALSVFGEWNGTSFWPLSVWSDRKFMALAGQSLSHHLRNQKNYGSNRREDWHPSWQRYMSAALVGTDRQVPALPKEDDALSVMVRQLDWSEPAAALLGVAGAIALHQAVGQQPTSPMLTPIELCEPDQLPCCNSHIAKYCERALAEHPMVVAELLDLMTAAGQRLSPTVLPNLLNFGVKRSYLQAQILPVLGNRGRWLASQNPAWHYACAPPAQRLELCQQRWETASFRTTRIQIFKQWRMADPNGARSALETTWSSETAKDRSAFINSFSSNVSVADEPFLEAALTDRTKAVKTEAAELLAQLPASRLCQRMGDRISQYVQFRGSGHQLTLTVQLPEQYDKAWQQDGILASPIQGLGEKAGWLQQLVAKTPLSLWPQDFTHLARVVEHHEWRAPLIAGWAKAAVSQQQSLGSQQQSSGSQQQSSGSQQQPSGSRQQPSESALWACGLLAEIGVEGLNEETLISLVMLLSQPQRETYLRSTVPSNSYGQGNGQGNGQHNDTSNGKSNGQHNGKSNDNNATIWLKLVAQPPQRWDYAFSQLALRQLVRLLQEKRKYGELFRPPPTLAMTLHPGLAPEANRAITALSYEQTFPAAWQRFLDDFLPALTLRWDIYQAFANSS